MTCLFCENLTTTQDPKLTFPFYFGDDTTHPQTIHDARNIMPNAGELASDEVGLNHYVVLAANDQNEVFLHSFDGNNEDVFTPIKFCPMCGRKLI